MNQMKSISEEIVVYNNDICDMIGEEVACFADNPKYSCIDTNEYLMEELYDTVCILLEKSALKNKENDTQAREIIDKRKNYVEPVEIDDIYNLFTLCLEDKEVGTELQSRLWDLMYDNSDLINDRLDCIKEDGIYLLQKEDYFKNSEKYIIFGENMGWRKQTGLAVKTIKNINDIINTVTGNYEYTIQITMNRHQKAYLIAHVSTHDSPMGETYYLIPQSHLKSIMVPEIQTRLSNFKRVLVA